MGYDFSDQLRALQHYEVHRNLSKAERELNISRSTLNRWKRDGVPDTVTGGLEWDQHLEKEDEKSVQKYTERKALQVQKDSVDFLERAKGDVIEIIEKLRGDLLDGKAEPKFADYEKLIRMYMRLDNQAHDRVLWQRRFIREVFRAVIKRVDDDPRLIEMLKIDLAQAVETSFQRLTPKPNPADLPDPQDQLPSEEELQEMEPEDADYVIESNGNLDPMGEPESSD